MTYPKARITRSRSRSRNMRKKHLVKSKSKRNNRSRKTKKTHSRKYRGGNLDRIEIEEMIERRDNGIRTGVTEMVEGTNFAKVSSVYEPVNTIIRFIRNNERVAMLGSTSEGALQHWLYLSDNNERFLIFDNPGRNEEPDIYYLRGWMLDAIFNEETEEREEKISEAKRFLV